MKDSSQQQFAATIGIDWADRKHDVCEIPAHSDTPLYSVIRHTPESIQQWAMGLLQRYPNQQVAVCCELKKGPLIYALAKYSHITLFPVNPTTVAQYRKAFANSGAKDDPSDALIQAEILILHRKELSAIKPETASIRALAQLTEYRRKLVQDRVNLSNKITATLKNYYPQVLDWFKEKDTRIFCDFIQKWPSLQRVKKARKATLITFFNQHHSRYKQVNEKRIENIKSALALTDDKGVIEPNQIFIELLIPQLQLLNDSITRIDKEIKQRYAQQADRKIFDSLPGAGAQLAPRILVAFGSDRSRYNDSSEIHKFAGIAPVIERSGKKSRTHWRYSCPKFLRQTFVEWAGLSIRYSFWAKAYYQQQSAKGKPHNTIIRSLAFKWIRIVFRCWKNKTPYDESTYLAALKKRNSPLLKFAVNM
jgi:transposase